MSNAAFNKRRSLNKKERRKQQVALQIGTIVAVVSLIVLILIITAIIKKTHSNSQASESENTQNNLYVADQPELDVQLLTINPYSRPGTALEQVNGIVVHYTANPGTSAIQNRNYFEGLKDGTGTSASSHFIIGLEGEIVQCVPCNEVAYASNDRNDDTISIECCIEDEEGKFNGNTYESLLHLVTWLMGRYDLTTDDVIRHYDITGKMCPKYYVEHPEAWEKFKQDLTNYIVLHGVKKESTEKMQ